MGTAFIEKWHEWKAGPDKAKNRKVIDVEREIERIFKFNTLDIGAAKEWNTLQVTVNRVPFKLQELGAGLAQFILLLGDAATSEPTLILIDEPELHLHPSLQSELLLTLGGFASEGLAFATHSLGLARSLGDRIFSFQRQGAGVKVAPFVSTPRYAEFLGEMSFVAYEEIGTDKIFLVEGASDVRVFQVLLRKFGKADDYVVVPLGGDQLARGDMEQELAELLRLTPKIRCVVDSERSEPGGSAKPERVAFAQTCQKLGIDLLVTERRAIENYFPETAIRAVKGSGYRALTLYERLANSERPWSKGENWRIALQMSAGDLTETDLGDFLADS